jgi:putative spermidine/putrescine transport system permease protein
VLVIILYAFTTEDRTYQFPPPGLTLHWFDVAFGRADIWQALSLSMGVAACATAVALVLGTLAAFALARAKFPGRDSVTALFVLPIALPGIITGIAMLAAMKLARLDASFLTIVAGHATFCTVIVYNNVIARLRRLPPSWVEASMDLGADGTQTLRYVLLPQVATGVPRRRHAGLSRCPSTKSSSPYSPPAKSAHCPSGSSTSCSGRVIAPSPMWWPSS